MPHRILHFIDTLGAGGAERQLLYLLSNLERKYYEASVLTTYDEFRHYQPQLEQQAVQVYSLHHGELSGVRRAQAVMRYIRLMWQLRPQVVHSWLHYPNLIARLARPFCPPHRLLTAIRTEYTPRQARLEHFTERFSDFRIVINKNQESAHTKLPTVTIPNAIDFDQFALSIPDMSLKRRDTFILLMVARIDPRKNHLALLEALHLLHKELPKGFKASIIGEITDSHTQAKIDKTIQNYGLKEFIEQKPPTHNIVPHYHAADVVLLPSKTEAFSNVILESFAARKPIIVSAAANNNVLVQHGLNGWEFPTDNIPALAMCIKDAWETSTTDRILMGKRGQEVARNYSIQRMVEQYTQLYDLVMSDSYSRT